MRKTFKENKLPSATERRFAMKPLAVLVDRSREAAQRDALVGLMPSRVFMTTDSRRRLSARLLDRYDVLAICGDGATAYTPKELAAVRAFVRRGGGLVLAACSGAFERDTGRPASQLAVNAVAGLFGFEFLSAAALPPEANACRGYARARITLTREGKNLGPTLGELWLGRPGPLAAPKGATVLLADRRSGQPIAAVGRYGRGRVLALNDLALWRNWNPWCPAHWLAAVAPEARRSPARPPDIIPTPYRQMQRDGTTVRYAGSTRRRVPQVVALADRVRREVLALVKPAKKPGPWRITVDPGTCVWHPWGPKEEIRCHVGADLSEAALTGALVRCLGARLVWSAAGLSSLSHPLVDGTIEHLQIRVLERMGFGEHAAALRHAPVARRGPDLGRAYSEATEPVHVRRLWGALEEAFGPDALTRFMRVAKGKDVLKGIPREVFGEFDLFAWLLARALGERVYAWLQARGHTLQRIPLEPPGSDALKRAMDRALERLLADPEEKPSDRFDAAVALAGRLAEDNVDLDRCTRRARSRRTGTAFPAAVRLVLTKDARGREALDRFVKGDDEGLAAVAALLLVFETADRRAANTLARLSPRFEARFQLSAGQALRIVGDRRAERFSFDRVKGCGLKVVPDGILKVFVTVDGYEVANVWGAPALQPQPYGNVHDTFHVYWVHTSPRWRRRGLARIGMSACLTRAPARRCAAVTLSTCSRWVAHALYRGFGLIDIRDGAEFHKQLRASLPVRALRGVRLRRPTLQDAVAASAFLNEQMASHTIWRHRLDLTSDQSVTWLAHLGRRLVGLAAAEVTGKSARLVHVAVAQLKDKKDKIDEKRRERLGAALLSAVHRDLVRRDVKEVRATFFHGRDDFLSWLLRRNGYGSRPHGGVELLRINRLGGYLREAAPILEQRLKDNKTWARWCGAIWLDGGRLRAGLRISRGTVTVTERAPDKPALTLRGDESAVTRIVTGVASPFEEYLQLALKARPSVNDRTVELVEVLFPRITKEHAP